MLKGKRLIIIGKRHPKIADLTNRLSYTKTKQA